MGVRIVIKSWYDWFLDVAHKRWMPWWMHPASLLLLIGKRNILFKYRFPDSRIIGDLSRMTKSDHRWRHHWPIIFLLPEYCDHRYGEQYKGWYWVWYRSSSEYGDEDFRCKLFPVRGVIAPRIGNDDVNFIAVTLTGKPIRFCFDGKLYANYVDTPHRRV